MVGAQHPLAIGEGLLVQGDGPVQVFGRMVGVGEVVAGGQSGGVVGTQHPLEGGEGLLQ